jgi:CubicO group peptidase (beta-lactamase class C family)
MILVEECKLRLDEPVDRLLPELADRKVLTRLDAPLDDTVRANRPITVRDLLTFRLGLGLIMASPDAYPILQAMVEQKVDVGPYPPSASGPDAWIGALGTLPLMHQPGERWMYHTGSDVLNVLIARASGQPLETFLRERIFEPLGMQDTGFHVPAEKLGRLASCYWTHPESGALELFDDARDSLWSRPPAFPSELVSTVDDYLAFGQMMLNKGRLGRERILSRLSVELMTTDHLTPEQKALSDIVPGYFESHGWGFGLSMVTRRDDLAGVPGRYGWDGGYGTSWASDPSEEMVAILMTQSLWTSPSPPDVYLDFWTSAYQAIDD